MRLRFLQTLLRKKSTSIDPNRIDYEESEDDSLISSLSPTINHRLSSSSTILCSNSFISLNHRLRQSTPSLFPTPSTSSTS